MKRINIIVGRSWLDSIVFQWLKDEESCWREKTLQQLCLWWIEVNFLFNYFHYCLIQWFFSSLEKPVCDRNKWTCPYKAMKNRQSIYVQSLIFWFQNKCIPTYRKVRLGTSIYVISWFDTSFDLAASIITLFYEYAKKILKYSSVELELGFAILYI